MGKAMSDDYGLRLGEGFKTTPEDKIAYLEAKVGKGNVAAVGDNIFILKGGKWEQLNPEGLDLGDVPGAVGPAIPAVASTATGMLTRSPQLSGLAGSAGQALREGISMAMEGGNTKSATETAKDVGIEGLLGWVGQHVGNFIGGTPARAANRTYEPFLAQADTPFAQEATGLSQRTGVPFTPGQTTGSKMALTMEGAVRRNPASADIVQPFDIAQTNAAKGFLERTQGAMDVGRAGSETAGTDLLSGFEKGVKDLFTKRSSEAAVDFGAVDAAAGGKEIIPVSNFYQTLMKLHQESKSITNPEGSKDLFNMLLAAGNRQAVTATELQNELHIFGEAAAGKRRLFQVLDDKAQERRVGKMLKSALEADLEKAAQTLPNQNAAKLLQFARDKYRANSQDISDVTEGTLAKVLGSDPLVAPEKVIEKITKLQPSDAQKVREMMERVVPDAIPKVKSAWIAKILREAQPASGGSMSGLVDFSPAKAVSALKAARPAMERFMDKGEIAMIEDGMKMLNRIADRAGTEGSPTAPLSAANAIMGVAATKALTAADATTGGGIMAIAAVTKAISRIKDPQAMARAMIDPNGLRALKTLATPNASVQAKLGALSILSLYGVEGAIRND